MVSLLSATLLFALAAGGAQDASPISVRCWAVEATREGHEPKRYDASAEEVRDALADLPFDTFVTVMRQQLQLPADQETRLALKDGYALYLRFLGRDADGRARVSARVELAPKTPDAPPRKVVETKLLLSRQGKARVGGLRTEKGELVLVLALQ